MKVGDLVKWIGFPRPVVPGASEEGVKITGPDCHGIIIKIYRVGASTRVDVLWADNTFGDALYPQTIEVISGNR